MKKRGKARLSFLLAVVMTLSLLPMHALAAAAGAPADHLVISQAYGGGGNSGATYKNDFVELYNPTDTDVALDGWVVKYGSKKAGSMADLNQETPLQGTIRAKGYYLIQMGAGAGGTEDLPTPDLLGNVNMSGKEFAVALFHGEECVDLLGVGSAKVFETKAAEMLSNTTAAMRKESGVDTDDNSADFAAVAPKPRNSADQGGEPTPPEGPAIDPAKVVSIQEALTGEKGGEFAVKGVVTFVESFSTKNGERSNIYLQDGTGAIGLTMTEKVTGVHVGDTYLGQGRRADFYALPQLSEAKLAKAAQQDMTLEAKETTISEILAGKVPLCGYVKLTGVDITEIYDNNGQWAAPNITVKQGEETIQLVKAVVNKGELAAGDTVDLTAAVSSYTKTQKNPETGKTEIVSTTTQLRNTKAEEIVKAADPDAPVTVAIREALAGAADASFTVKGVVTMSDGWNVYLQDESGAIALNLAQKDTTLRPGDTLIATGVRKENNGVPYLGDRSSGAVIEKSSGMSLTAKNTTIDALTEADLCTYVHLSGLEVLEVDDHAGQWRNPSIKVQDANGHALQIYKAVIDKNADGTWAVKKGDKINVSAAVGRFQEQYQLRNTLPEEITVAMDPADPMGILGKQVVIYNPAVRKAISKTADGFNRAGVDVTVKGDEVTGYTRDEIWTVGSDGQGHFLFTALDGGQRLAMDGSHMSLGLDQENAAWMVSEGTSGCAVITNVQRKGCTMQWNTFNGAANFSAFNHAKDPDKNLKFYVVTELPRPDVTPGAPEEGAEVFIYNLRAKGVLAGQFGTDSPSIKGTEAAMAEGKATAGNGGRLFTVERNGEYYRFKNEHDGYLCSNGTGNNAFYQETADESADWKVTEFNKGFKMESRVAKFNGQHAQFLEYYGDSYKTYSFYKVDPKDYDIFTFQFLPCANEAADLMQGIVNRPAVVLGELGSAYVSKDYTLAFTVDAPFGYQSGEVTLNGKKYSPALVEGQYVVTVPAAEVTGDTLHFTIDCVDGKDVAFTAQAEVPVVDVPLISDPTPQPNSAVMDSRRPEISVMVQNGGEAFRAEMAVNNHKVTPVIEGTKVSYVPEKDLADGPVTVGVKIIRADKAENTYTWKFSIGQPMEQLYFGQLHAHTQYSDGAGSLASALDYIGKIPERDNVDFVAFTDHSNYFDGAKMGGSVLKEQALYNMSSDNGATEQILKNWNTYKGSIADFNAGQSDVIALGGFEMTWSGGPGHINTFNTPGIVSRNNKTLNDKTMDAGMKAYYALLKGDTEAAQNGAKNWDGSAYDGKSLSQFNHPGKTFGTFKDFAYWDPAIDERMVTVEVGNGEGKIHQGGYYPSYEEYTKALDKGWHLAPTNNQDNHKGRWGNANDARDVILTDNFSEEGIYQAMRDRRMYATEDKNLQMTYQVNGQPMGSLLPADTAELNVQVDVHDPDPSDAIAKVELIVNSGRVAYTWDKAEAAAGSLTCTLPAEYSYYYVRVTEADGDLAVTAPVWVGEVLKLGIASVECDTPMPVTGEELNVVTTLFNSENAPATVRKITYTNSSTGQVLAEDTEEKTVAPSGNLVVKQPFTFEDARLYTVKVTVSLAQGDKNYTYSMDLEMDVEDAGQLVYIGFDAAHYNEYVSGNYKDSMGNFANLASRYAVRTVYLETSEDLISACGNAKYKMLILTAPSRRLPEAQADPRFYSPEEIAALKAFHEAGGIIVMAGWSDHYESADKTGWNPKPGDLHMSEAQNAVLEALGSSLRINDDATYDDTYSKIDGCDPWRLYFNTYNQENPLNEGVIYDADHPYDDLYTERFSHYGGASVYAVGDQLPDTVSPVVFGHESTYSVDSDQDGKGVVGGKKYASPKNDERLLIMATEQLPGKGLIIVSGAAFMSNFEVQMGDVDNNAQKNYSNYRICENLLKGLNEKKITPIAEVQAEEQEGVKFTIEGVVTSNASGFDANTAFFDCIYVQDDTAGINAFPVAGNYQVGDKVRISGHTSSYNGERQIAVKQVEKIGSGEAPAPKSVTAAQVNDGSVLGSLITLQGTVTSFTKDTGMIQTVTIRDEAGEETRVFIDGYITKSTEVQDLAVGCTITVTGLASYDNSFAGPAPRIRIRDRADLVCTAGATPGYFVVQ